jgi:rRNA maturation endonuclease Nob1
MQLGSILVILAISIFMVAYISQPFQSETEDLEKVIDARVKEIRKQKIKAQISYCTQCGHRLNTDDRFCAQCGTPVETSK